MNLIHDSFQYGDNFKIGSFNVIEKNVKVGNNVEIKNFVELRPYTIIRNNVRIDSYVVSSGHNYIGNDVTIRYRATIARNVIIGDHVFIAPHIMFINIPFTIKERRKTVIGEDVQIGANSVINDGVRIVEGTIIGALSFVRKDIMEKGVYGGNPLRRIR